VFDKKGKFLKTLKIDNLDEKQRSVIGIIENRYLVLGTSKIPGKIGMEFTILDIEYKYEKVSEFKATEDIDFEIPTSSRGYLDINTSGNIRTNTKYY